MATQVRAGDEIPTDCSYCYHGGKNCSKRSPDDRWYCTREKGHRDDHVACAKGADTHGLAQWVNLLDGDRVEPKFHPIWVPPDTRSNGAEL